MYVFITTFSIPEERNPRANVNTKHLHISCLKLTMSLINDSLKFQMTIYKYSFSYFLLKGLGLGLELSSCN